MLVINMFGGLGSPNWPTGIRAKGIITIILILSFQIRVLSIRVVLPAGLKGLGAPERITFAPFIPMDNDTEAFYPDNETTGIETTGHEATGNSTTGKEKNSNETALQPFMDKLGGNLNRTQRDTPGLYAGPYFDPSTPNNVTSQLGTHAFLPCKIRQLNNKSVSWIRRRDSHILTVDRFTFIADERFQSFLKEHADSWNLQIKYVQARDRGVYECQIGTEPKMSHFITLEIVDYSMYFVDSCSNEVPNVVIPGETELYVRTGSVVSIKCVITQCFQEPGYIFWYHNKDQRIMNTEKKHVETSQERISSDTMVATLKISPVSSNDAGNYTCAPTGMHNASVFVHVLKGTSPAAILTGNAARLKSSTAAVLVVFLIALAFGYEAAVADT